MTLEIYKCSRLLGYNMNGVTSTSNLYKVIWVGNNQTGSRGFPPDTNRTTVIA